MNLRVSLRRLHKAPGHMTKYAHLHPQFQNSIYFVGILRPRIFCSKLSDNFESYFTKKMNLIINIIILKKTIKSTFLLFKWQYCRRVQNLLIKKRRSCKNERRWHFRALFS